MKSLIVSIGMVITAASTYAISHSASTADVKARLEHLATSNARGAGFATKPGVGRFAFVSLQSRFSTATLENEANSLGGQLKFPVEVVSATEHCNFLNLGALKQSLGLDVALFLIADESMPMSIVVLEERWAVINVAKVFDTQKSERINNKRLHNEVSRVAKALFSAVNVQPNQKAVSTGDDLDALTVDPIDSNSLATMLRGLSSFGLVAPRTVPYYRACQEGWAPPPTNAIQRAIWEKVHQIPDKPIKIEFDPKKDK